MRCLGCGQETIFSEWGDWCDPCGGVVVAGSPPRLFFRHVATVKGDCGIFAVVYDISAEQYGVAWPRKVVTTKCIHCGQNTPIDVRTGLAVLDDLQHRGFHSKRGTLDAMLAFVQPMARGGSSEIPILAPAPSVTDEERRIIGA
jgi:hypothetical protein